LNIKAAIGDIAQIEADAIVVNLFEGVEQPSDRSKRGQWQVWGSQRCTYVWEIASRDSSYCRIR
jgi:hypothetical protein